MVQSNYVTYKEKEQRRRSSKMFMHIYIL